MHDGLRGLKWRRTGEIRWKWVTRGGDGGTQRLPRPFRSEGAARLYAREMLAKDAALEIRIVALAPEKAAVEQPSLFPH